MEEVEEEVRPIEKWLKTMKHRKNLLYGYILWQARDLQSIKYHV